MSERMPKVNELVKQAVGQIINENLEFPADCLLTITAVSVSKDLKYAKVLISVIPPQQKENILAMLIRAKNIIQRELGQKIILRSTPKLQFMIDDKEEKAAELDYLLDHLDK